MGGSWAVAPEEWDDGGGLYEEVEAVGQVWQWEDRVVDPCVQVHEQWLDDSERWLDMKCV